jgi:hypothetical protein
MVYDGVMHKVLASGARGLTLALMWSPPKLGGHFSTNKHVEGPNTTGRIEWCTERLYGVMLDHLHTCGHVSYLRASGILPFEYRSDQSRQTLVFCIHDIHGLVVSRLVDPW